MAFLKDYGIKKKNGHGELLVLSWPSIDGAIGYQIYRYILVNYGTHKAEDKGETEYVWVEWKTVRQKDGVVRASVPVLEYPQTIEGYFAITALIFYRGALIESDKFVIYIDPSAMPASVRTVGWAETRKRVLRGITAKQQ